MSFLGGYFLALSGGSRIRLRPRPHSPSTELDVPLSAITDYGVGTYSNTRSVSLRHAKEDTDRFALVLELHRHSRISIWHVLANPSVPSVFSLCHRRK